MYGVTDLDAATVRFEADFGLPVTEGGTHPDGTRNRTVDCKDGTYLELLAVTSPTSPEATWIQEQILAGTRLLGWDVLVEDIVAVSARLDLPATPGSIELPDGRVGSWQIVGVAESMADPSLPFFIKYDRSPEAGSAPPAQPDSPEGIAWIEVAGDQERLRHWLGGTHSRLRIVDVGAGARGVRAVALSRGGEELVLR